MAPYPIKKKFFSPKSFWGSGGYHHRVISKPGVLPHASNPSTRKAKAVDGEFKASLGYTGDPISENQNVICMYAYTKMKLDTLQN